MVTVKTLQNNISYLSATVKLQKSISYDNRQPEGATAVVVAPDDGHEDARNMLSCI
jgi:hypothetical protein